MKTKTEHSPLPWQRNLWTTGRWTMDDKAGMQVCEFNITHEGQGSIEDNAAFVERAVNFHQELLDTLRFIRQTVHQAHHEGPIDGCRKNTCDAVTQALAKTEGL